MGRHVKWQVNKEEGIFHVCQRQGRMLNEYKRTLLGSSWYELETGEGLYDFVAFQL